MTPKEPLLRLLITETVSPNNLKFSDVKLSLNPFSLIIKKWALSFAVPAGNVKLICDDAPESVNVVLPIKSTAVRV